MKDNFFLFNGKKNIKNFFLFDYHHIMDLWIPNGKKKDKEKKEKAKSGN